MIPSVTQDGTEVIDGQLHNRSTHVEFSSALPQQGHAIGLEGGRLIANHVQNKSSTVTSTLMALRL